MMEIKKCPKCGDEMAPSEDGYWFCEECGHTAPLEKEAE